MEKVIIDKKDELVMRLVHYFVTEQNYTPIIVNGAKNEVWLENLNHRYRIIRINSNYIHNQEQLNFHIYKTKNVIKQIKVKTLSLKIKILDIFLDVRDDVPINDIKNMSLIKIDSMKELKNNQTLLESFPDIKNNILKTEDKLDFIMNVAKDINEKTTVDNKQYEETFKKKPIMVTYILMAINIFLFILTLMGLMSEKFDLARLLILDPARVVKNFEVYRLITVLLCMPIYFIFSLICML